MTFESHQRLGRLVKQNSSNEDDPKSLMQFYFEKIILKRMIQLLFFIFNFLKFILI